MPRSRNIKPSLFKNELLGEADPLLTILFTGLWCLADRDGKMEDRPKRIRAEIFPYRELTDFNGYLTQLEQLGFIVRYSVDGVAVIQVMNFTRHQSPHNTERASELPEMPLKTPVCDMPKDEPLDNGSVTVKESLIPDSGFLIPDSKTKPPKSPKGDSVNYDKFPDQPDPAILKDWLSARRKAKAAHTQTAMDRIGGELHKAKAMGFAVDDCLAEAATRTWRGFKAEWMKNAGHNTGYQSNTVQVSDPNDTSWADGFDPHAGDFENL